MGPPDHRTSMQSRTRSHYHDDSISSQDSSQEGPQQTRPGVLEEGLPEGYEREHKHAWTDRLAKHVPPPVRKSSAWVINWARGPTPPRIWRIRPFLPQVQTAPLRVLDQYAPKPRQRFWLLIFLYFCWLLCFITVLHHSAFSDEVPGYGSPSLIACTDAYWINNNGCGLNGNDCRPFGNTTEAFRCPANCLSTEVLNPRAIGDEVVNYRPLVIGGPNDTANSVETAIYRGDSFICSAAIHSGFITNEEGGCGVVSLIGNYTNFLSVNQHGIESIAFNSDFPLSYQFLKDTRTTCKDLRWPLLAVTIIFTVLLSLFTTSPAIFFWSSFCAWFMHVALVSDPPSQSNYYGLVSSALGRFLPAAFCAFVIYKYCVKRTLLGLEAQIEKTVLWLGACIVGCLNNYTFDKIPIQRLTPHDLKQQPGAITALVIIVLVILVIALGQAWAIRVEGRMPRYLALYLLMGFCLGMLAAVPDMSLRIHHYILALLLLPGTAMQNRPSLLYQGLLVGLFINGIARWGFDSVLQTAAQLQGDALLGSALPNITAPVFGANNVTFTWPPIPDKYDGLSVLVNDVERYRGYEYDGPMNFTWTRTAPMGAPEYFRFGFLSGSSPGDYTRAGVWRDDGSWVEMPEGAT